MQALILAAGKSTRTYPLTITRPKPMLKAANKPLLEHNLEALNGIVSEAIIVVGYRKEQIKDHFGSRYKNIKIRYVEQKEQLGTGHAVAMAEKHIKDRLLIMMGDDIYSKDDIANCARYPQSLMVSKVKNPSNFGVVTGKNGMLQDFFEKPEKFVSDLASTAFYSTDTRIFGCLKKIKLSKRGELELPDAVKLLSKETSINCVKASQWLPIAYPWDLLKADMLLRKNKNFIGKSPKITGNVENSSIGDNCTINGDVRNSIIMDNAVVKEGSIAEYSLLGENVNFRGKIMAKNNAVSAVNGKNIVAERLGAVIGDNSRIDNCTINAGCKIWPNKKLSNTNITKDII
ncbi:NTP transferase domain-containing protein [Candidatus Woesearchaeota archaeon]|nr:NTP transferase domain-containing protein [Candidatus Woesearchaeota archaeon]